MPIPTFNQLWLQVRAGVYGWVKGGHQGQPRPIAVDDQGRLIITTGAAGGGGVSGVAVEIAGQDVAASHHHEPAANTAAVVTLAAPGAGVSNVIGQVTWSYDGEPTSGTLTIAQGATTIFKVDITTSGPGPISWPVPMKFAANSVVTVTLAAGGAGISGIVNVHAWTE